MKLFKEFLTLTFGTMLVAVGVYFFKFPNNFSTGGVSGISVILGSVFKSFSPGTVALVINLVLLVLGYLLVGHGFGSKTAYCSVLLSIAVYGFEKLIPLSRPLTNQPLLELLFSILLPSVGAAILFNTRASTGGTDIVAMILKKYTNLKISESLFLTDCLIVLTACFVFGIETGLFSILGLLSNALVVDNVIESINVSKYFTIITQKPDEIIQYINQTLKRSATCSNCKGVFFNEDRTMLLTALSRSEAVNLKKYIKIMDPKAFIVILNSSDIIGKGFREVF